MATQGFALFDTAIGRCAIAWGERGVRGVRLPEANERSTRLGMARAFPEACEGSPPPEVQGAIDGIAKSLRGEGHDLSGVKLDLGGVTPFHRRVYEVTRRIEPGQTLSYGEVAAQLGGRGLARAVGQALGRNPFPLVVPCHRVLAASGRIGGFSAPGGTATKLRLLDLETAQGQGPRGLFEGDGELAFDTQQALQRLRASDSGLARVIDAVGPCRLKLEQTQSVFFALAQAIVHQQLTGKAAETIFARLCALFPRAPQAGLSPERILRASDEKLRGAGLSRAKVLALRDLAQKTKQGSLPTWDELHAMSDEAIIESLTAVRGVGRWTAEMLLIFRLGRPDVLPVDDYGIRKGFAIAFRKRELPARKDLEARGERWRPYRTLASWYLWRAVERAGS